jgi:elongation factor G
MKRLDYLRNIGISAHIDSGKTTLTERMLFYTGRIHRIAEVRGKDGIGATMDSMELEKERGITIQSAATFCEWKLGEQDHFINIIDTPGHVDFTIEVERALSVLDGAVLVLCSVGGVQSQSMTVDRQMRRYNVPRVAFINKMDRNGADAYLVATQLREKLHHNAVMVQAPIGTGYDFEGVVDLVQMNAIYNRGEQGEEIVIEAIPEAFLAECEDHRNTMIEQLADYDEDLAEKFLEAPETITEDDIHRVIRAATLTREITPVFVGSAYRNKAVQALLDGVCRYLPNPGEVVNQAYIQVGKEENQVVLHTDNAEPLCALAFKLDDTAYGQLTYTRVYQGILKKGEFIYNSRTKRNTRSAV